VRFLWHAACADVAGICRYLACAPARRGVGYLGRPARSRPRYRGAKNCCNPNHNHGVLAHGTNSNLDVRQNGTLIQTVLESLCTMNGLKQNNITIHQEKARNLSNKIKQKKTKQQTQATNPSNYSSAGLHTSAPKHTAASVCGTSGAPS
jgi:hypothetical protein